MTQKLRINPERKLLWNVSTFFAHSGDSWYCLGVLLLIWLFTKGEWHRIAAALASGTVLLTMIILALKFSIRRRRPDGEWGAIYRNTDPHSFPSGHATRVFFLASLAWGIAPIWCALMLTIWAPLVALSRVMTGVHYLSDILAGKVLGITLGIAAIFLLPWIIKLFPFAF